MTRSIKTLQLARPVSDAVLRRLADLAHMPAAKHKQPIKISPVPDEVLQQLANLGHVSSDQHNFFFSAIRMHVQTAWELSALVKRGLTKKNGAALLRAALELYEVLGNLNNDDGKLIDEILGDKSALALGKISGEGLHGLRRTAYELVLLFSLVTGKPHPGYPYEARQLRHRGRRPGTKKDSVFQNFVCALLIFTNRVRGRFTLEKNGPTGTLIEAIEMLAPHLPVGFVPDPLPGSILQRLKAWCDQISVDLDDVDYGLDALWMYSLYPRPYT
jgi:hypothetical protein